MNTKPNDWFMNIYELVYNDSEFLLILTKNMCKT